MNNRIHIAIAEPSLILRTGLVSVLKRITALNIVIYEINDLSHLESVLIKSSPDVLIINPACIGFGGIATLKKNTKLQRIKYIALQTTLLDVQLLNSYEETIGINASAEQIKEIITKLSVFTHGDASAELSQREKDVIIAVVESLTNKEIANKLHISVNTVMTHRKNIANKLQIHSPAGLAIYAVVNKLVKI